MMVEKTQKPTLGQVAKVAKVNRSYLGVIAKDLCKELNIKLPKGRKRAGKLNYYSVPFRFKYVVRARNKKEADKLAFEEVKKHMEKWGNAK